MQLPTIDRRRQPVPLPPQLGGINEVTIHPVLRYDGKCPIEYDITGTPSSWTQRTAPAEGEQILHHPVTEPPLPSISLVIPGFPWMIIAHASAISRGMPAVTVGDVLWAIHHAVQQPAAEEGRRGNALGLEFSPGQRATVGTAVPRIKRLNGQHVLLGLSASDMGSDVMVAHVRPR